MSTKLPVLFIDVIDLEWETVTKNLGVFIDENVILKTHINIIFTKISKSIGKLYKAMLMFPRKQLNQTYFSFVDSYLNCENLAWGSTQITRLSTLFCQRGTQ